MPLARRANRRREGPTFELAYGYVDGIAFHHGDVRLVLAAFTAWIVHAFFILGTLLLALARFDVEYWRYPERRELNKRVAQRLTTLFTRTRIEETPKVSDT